MWLQSPQVNFQCCRANPCDYEGLPDWAGWRLYDGRIVQTCPWRLIDDRAQLFLMLHLHYRRGFLPYPGALADQPALYVEAMTYLEDLLK